MTLYYFELKRGIIVVCYEKDTHTIVYLFNYSFTLMSQFLPKEPFYCADKINETSIMLSYPKSIAILSAQSDKLIVKYTLPLWNFASNFIVIHDEIIYSNNQSVEALNVETKKITLLWKNEGDTDDPLSCIDFSYGVIPQMNLYSIGYTERIDFFDWNSHQIVKSFSNPINKDISTEMSCPFVMKNKFFFLYIREKNPTSYYVIAWEFNEGKVLYSKRITEHFPVIEKINEDYIGLVYMEGEELLCKERMFSSTSRDSSLSININTFL